jgi:hypothetical protein
MEIWIDDDLGDLGDYGCLVPCYVPWRYMMFPVGNWGCPLQFPTARFASLRLHPW